MHGKPHAHRRPLLNCSTAFLKRTGRTLLNASWKGFPTTMLLSVRRTGAACEVRLYALAGSSKITAATAKLRHRPIVPIHILAPREQPEPVRVRRLRTSSRQQCNLCIAQNRVFSRDFFASVRGWVSGHHVPFEWRKQQLDQELRLTNMIPLLKKWVSCCGHHVAGKASGARKSGFAGSFFMKL